MFSPLQFHIYPLIDKRRRGIEGEREGYVV
jgi:hypothetical protein